MPQVQKALIRVLKASKVSNIITKYHEIFSNKYNSDDNISKLRKVTFLVLIKGKQKSRFEHNNQQESNKLKWNI